MSDLCVLLVHGYLGATADLEPLATALEAEGLVVDRITLPGHGLGGVPVFDREVFLEHLAEHIEARPKHDYVLLGHSTGGNLILAELARRAHDLDGLAGLRLVILAATPARIDAAYALRWGEHLAARPSVAAPALDDLGALARLVNRSAPPPPIPMLLLHGEADELVTEIEAGRATGPTRVAVIPDAHHHLFQGSGAQQAVDCALHAILDASRRVDASRLTGVVNDMTDFIAAWPDRALHLLNGPAGRRAVGLPFAPTARAASAPTLANIEITTRCTLGCASCARTQLKLQSRHMPLATFRAVLTALPHAWRVNLVGLGEPLLHPEVVEFVRIATADGRRVALVTNAMQLAENMAEGLLAAGLAAITFSLDALTPTRAEQLRKGSDLDLIRTNILAFQAKRHGRKVGSAIFTAITAESVEELPGIVDFALEAKVDALMLSDLNFPANQGRALAGQLDAERAASLRQTLRHAARRGLPVLGVRGLEEYALETRYLDFLALRGEQLAERSPRHSHCFSPWQTVPVNVEGHATICDCQPRADLGDILHLPLDGWWNGARMRDHRERMLGENPPADCLVCPRY